MRQRKELVPARVTFAACGASNGQRNGLMQRTRHYAGATELRQPKSDDRGDGSGEYIESKADYVVKDDALTVDSFGVLATRPPQDCHRNPI